MAREGLSDNGMKCHGDQTRQHCLLIYIEPTPYILGLLREIEQLSTSPIKVIFLNRDLTQPWGINLEQKNVCCLPKGRWQSLREMYRAVSERPAIIHLAGWSQPLILVALVLAKIMQVPVTIESDTQLPFELPMWKKIVKSQLYPWFFRPVDGFFPGGTRQSKYLRYYGVPERKIRVAQMTVDVKLIQQTCRKLGADGRTHVRKKMGINETSTVFVFVGRLVSYKGIADLLEAFERISCDISEAVLLIVGEGPELERVVSSARINSAIHFTGRLEQKAVIEMLHAADISVVPSYLDQWGLVVNEAMAAGLPVIASDRVGAVDDLVLDGKTGIVFKCGDVDALFRAMECLSLNGQLREEYADAGNRLISGWKLSDSAEIIVHGWQQIVQQRVETC